MKRSVGLLVLVASVLAGCVTTQAPIPLGPDGKPLQQVYRLDGQGDAVTFRMLDSVNALRQARGLQPLQLDAQLNAAAATHSRDMSVQNRPWHFGSDGSSPYDRVRRVGFTGRLGGELISETFQTELETLAAWSANPETLAILVEPNVQLMGFAWYQEPAGKIWWTLVTGSR